jgi:DNA-binding transcriptional MerR regulator
MRWCRYFCKWDIAPHLVLRYEEAEMLIDKEEAEFTLAEVERLTGFNTETVRAWRKRNYLPPQERYAKIGLRELASLAVRKQLLNHGFGPANSREIADQYAAMVTYIAVLDTPGSCEVRGTAPALTAFEEKFSADEELARTLSGMAGDVVTLLISTDSSELTPDVELQIDQDSLSGYYINLLGLGRQLGAEAGKPLFKVHAKLKPDEPGRILVRRIPRLRS